MSSFCSVIDEATRNFKEEVGEKADTIFLTGIGMKALRNCNGGCSEKWFSAVNMPETFEDGDIVLGLIVRFTDEKLLHGFRLSSSSQRKDKPPGP